MFKKLYVTKKIVYDLQEYDQLVTQQKEIEEKLHEMESSPPR